MSASAAGVAVDPTVTLNPPGSHVLARQLDEAVAYPPHPPRTESTVYKRTHHHLVYEMDAPCWICGIRHSTGGAMETHHYRFEWASQFGLALTKVEADFPDLTDRQKLADWVDGEGNMLVLCAAHHRGKYTGIHSITYPAWLLQRYEGAEFSFIDQHAVPKAHTGLLAKGDPCPDGASAVELDEEHANALHQQEARMTA